MRIGKGKLAVLMLALEPVPQVNGEKFIDPMRLTAQAFGKLPNFL
jgi:hypothetical protein